MTALTARPGRPLLGTAVVPGDKSCSHRALILAAMANGESLISGLNEAADVQRTIAAIAAFGAIIEQVAAGTYGIAAGRGPRPERRSSAATAAPPRDC